MFRVSGQRNKQKYGRVSSARPLGKVSLRNFYRIILCDNWKIYSSVLRQIGLFWSIVSILIFFIVRTNKFQKKLEGSLLESIEKLVACCIRIICRHVSVANWTWYRYTTRVHKLDIPWPRIYCDFDFPLILAHLPVLETYFRDVINIMRILIWNNPIFIIVRNTYLMPFLRIERLVQLHQKSKDSFRYRYTMWSKRSETASC